MSATPEMIVPIEIHQAEVIKKLNKVIEDYIESEEFELIETFQNQIIDILQKTNFTNEGVELAIEKVEAEVDGAISKQMTGDYLAALGKTTAVLKMYRNI